MKSISRVALFLALFAFALVISALAGSPVASAQDATATPVPTATQTPMPSVEGTLTI